MFLFDEHLTVETRPRGALVEAFASAFEPLGFTYESPTGLVSPDFPAEFNRCIDHGKIRDHMRHGLRACWWNCADVCRLSDSKKLSSGNYSSHFRVFVAVAVVGQSEVPSFLSGILRGSWSFLQTAGIPAEELEIAYFGGSSVPDRMDEPQDEQFVGELTRLMPPPASFTQVRGPKHFLLFLADGERAGPKAELRTTDARGAVEIGTFLLDRFLVREAGPDHFSLEESAHTAIGVAFGLERLLGAVDGAPLWDTEPFVALEGLFHTTGADRAYSWLAEDRRIIADQVKCALFLLAHGVLDRGSSSQLVLFESVVERIVRKSWILEIDDLPGRVMATADLLTADRPDVPVHSFAPMLIDLLQQVPTAAAWNPRGFRSHPGAWLPRR